MENVFPYYGAILFELDMDLGITASQVQGF